MEVAQNHALQDLNLILISRSASKNRLRISRVFNSADLCLSHSSSVALYLGYRQWWPSFKCPRLLWLVAF